MYLQLSNTYNSEVKEVQHLLNNARLNGIYLNQWEYLKEDGIYGIKTQEAVRSFQRIAKIQQTGIVGDQTYRALSSSYQTILAQRMYISAAPERELYISAIPQRESYISATIQERSISNCRGCSSSNSILFTRDGMLTAVSNVSDISCLFFEISNEMTKIQSLNDSAINVLSKKGRIGLKKYDGVLKNAKNNLQILHQNAMSGSLVLPENRVSKEILIDYLKKMNESIMNSRIKITADNIKRAIRPFCNAIKRIPLLAKYGGELLNNLNVIIYLVNGTRNLIAGEYEGALQNYLNGLRLAIEGMAIAALILSGAWIWALVLAVVLMIIEYLFFSENAGDTLVDNVMGRKVTMHFSNEVVSSQFYHLFY